MNCKYYEENLKMNKSKRNSDKDYKQPMTKQKKKDE